MDNKISLDESTQYIQRDRVFNICDYKEANKQNGSAIDIPSGYSYIYYHSDETKPVNVYYNNDNLNSEYTYQINEIKEDNFSTVTKDIVKHYQKASASSLTAEQKQQIPFTLSVLNFLYNQYTNDYVYIIDTNLIVSFKKKAAVYSVCKSFSNPQNGQYSDTYQYANDTYTNNCSNANVVKMSVSPVVPCNFANQTQCSFYQKNVTVVKTELITDKINQTDSILYTLEKEYFSDRSLTYTIKSKDSIALVFSYSSVSTSDFEIHDQEAVIVFDNFISENANAILESSHLDNTTETKNSYLMSLI
jgi:hypothetical protein